jgi:hypothetical protein|tara:strand:- start:7 stop:321 length:315 start_codon:yes stop_codon:yes gene_type:complete
MKAQLVTIYWRDIPAQVTAQKGRTREKALLDARFQHAIDRAAMVADMSDTDSYVAQWRRESVSLTTDLAAAVASEATRIDTSYDRERLERLVRLGGVEDNQTSI